MSNIIDRRKNPSGKSTGNRQRFIKRMEGQIRRALPNIIGDGSIRDMSSKDGKVKVPVKGVNEPEFVYDHNTGTKQIVRPGNDRYMSGDRIKKPDPQGAGAGRGKGSKDVPDWEDTFTIVLTKDEFLKYFFDDLELPNMVKVFLEKTKKLKYKRAGYANDGNPSRLNIVKSFQKSLSRRIGVGSVLQKKLKRLEEELEKADDADKGLILNQIERVKKQLKTIPFLDSVDLKYNNFKTVPTPATKAVMFCVMDVSASMQKHHKSIAKRFFTLLYLFLTKTYEDVELVFVRHHTESKEVSEEEFFEGKETGGTIVAPALEMVDKIIDDRYSDGWNIYCCQASDGDVWGEEDAAECASILLRKLLDKVQYMAYVEINKPSDQVTDLMKAYKTIKDENFQTAILWHPRDIWQVFKQLFKKKVGS